MKNQRSPRLILFAILAIAALAALPSRSKGEVILQYFDGTWETIDRRMPDIFMAGYGALWLPPAARADSGDQSVGFDVFDRFDLGSENHPTLYGTESDIRYMVRQAHDAGVRVFFDTVYNHNGFSDGRRGDGSGESCALHWAVDQGGYPGFVMSGRDLGLPFSLEFRDICGSTVSCDSDPIDCRVSNLIDINHDTDYRWIRHPVDPGNPKNIPYQAYRVTPDNRRFYPDRDLVSPYDDGVYPFNLADPMQGDPTEENVNMMLQRYTQWALEAIGVDGFRIDAMKHQPAGWFTNVYDFAAHNRGRDFWGRQTTPFSFGEMVDGNWDNLRPYNRRDGYGNRTVLDFPLKFAMSNNIGNPSGSLAAIIASSADGIDDGDTENGSAGVQFVQSHDNNYIGDPPALQNMAYAHILSRKGVPVVYYNAKEFLPTLGQRDFPNNNTRADALGRYGTIITRLVAIHNDFVDARQGNGFRSLWQDSDVVAYEMNQTLVVGLCDRDDRGTAGLGYEERAVSNFGFRNVTLVEVTGNAADSNVDPANDIPDTITIPASGSFTFRIPTNENRNGVKHGKPYVMYSLLPPQGKVFGNTPKDVGLRVLNRSYTLGPDSTDVYEAVARLTPVDVVNADTAQVELQIDQAAGSLEDNALIKWNYGVNIDNSNEGDFGIQFGVDDPLLAGFENFTNKSVSAGGGTGTYRIDVDLTKATIPEGYNYITAIAFLPRLSTLPPLFTTFRKVIYVDRHGPDLRLVYPATQNGVDDIQSATFGFVVENPDGTGNSMHYFWDLPDGVNPVDAGLLDSSNKATRTDRIRWRFSLDNLTTGQNQKLTLVIFEETGNYTVKDYALGVKLSQPTQTPVNTPTPTAAPTSTSTHAPTATPEPTMTSIPTTSPTSTAGPTATLAPTIIPTATTAPTETSVPTPSPIATSVSNRAVIVY